MVTNAEVEERVKHISGIANRGKYELEFICLAQDIMDVLAEKMTKGSIQGKMVHDFRSLWFEEGDDHDEANQD